MNYQGDMSFLDHLEVFRWHLIRSMIAIMLFASIAFVFKDFIFDTVLLGPKDPQFITYRILCSISNFIGLQDVFCFTESPFSLINISMSGQFSTHITTSIFAGFIIAFPYVTWEIWTFVRPALHDSESRSIRGVVFFSSILFMLGVMFGYYVVSPISINFLGSYNVSDTISNQITLSSFIVTVTTITLANGIIFELPILVYFLTKLGLLTPEFMRIYRRHALILTLLLSAIITPPDITSQILVAVPIIILYEISIKISAILVKRQNI